MLASAGASAKTSTGLVGLAVEPQWKEKLLGLYQKTLDNAAAMPADSKYRQNVEATTTFRQRVVQEESIADVAAERINCGQVEELIVQATDELSLMKHYTDLKLWEPAPKEQ